MFPIAFPAVEGLHRAAHIGTDSLQEKARGEAHLHLCILADKLEVEPLKDLATRNFLEAARTANHTQWVVQALRTILKEMPLCADEALTKLVMEAFLDNWRNVAAEVKTYLRIVNALACMYAERLTKTDMNPFLTSECKSGYLG